MPSEDKQSEREVVRNSDTDETVKLQQTETQSNTPETTEPCDKGQSPDSDSKPDHGYDLYPERQGGKYKPSVWEHFFLREGENLSDQITCEKNVYNCFKKSKCHMKYMLL